MKAILIILFLLTQLTACDKAPWNDPHQHDTLMSNTGFSSFIEPPKTLDPARAYSAEELLFIAQVYEPILQYDYLKRPDQLILLTATAMPQVHYWDQAGQLLPDNAPTQQVAYTTYDIQIKPGIFYQPHPAFAQTASGAYRYQHLTQAELAGKQQLSDFPQTGTRELRAEDYVYQIKRLADPQINSPIAGTMQEHILGMTQYIQQLRQLRAQNHAAPFFDLRPYNFPGAQVLGPYTYRITLKGKYPQFIYWLAMPFFAPMPWEVDQFFAQPGMQAKNLSLDWYPVGTGAYMLSENNPNARMVLTRNPNFHPDFYPSTETAADEAAGFLTNAGKRLPLVDKFVFNLEKESIPRWNKFLQGYYDASLISKDSFDQAIHVNEQGIATLTPAMQAKNIRLITATDPAIYYIGFNMLDPVVGGYDIRAQKLRQAISMAIDYEEYINIFLNGRGVPAQGPLPPQIFGNLTGDAAINPYVYTWQHGRPQRRSLVEAKKLLAAAGYPNGQDIKTGKRLVLNYDTPTTSAPDDKAVFDWLREQFAQLGIELNVRATQYNRFQDKIRQGDTQLFAWAWSADYPDPENFFALLYSGNSSVKYGGINSSNYANPRFDALFEQMASMPNSPQRLQIIQQMLAIVRQDAPWIWGIYPKTFLLLHAWNAPIKIDSLGNNFLKYRALNVQLRAEKIQQWNTPKIWPLVFLFLFFVLISLPVVIRYYQQQNRPRVKKFDTLENEED